jgi:hypothetical protein
VERQQLNSVPALIEAIDIKRKDYFEYEQAPYHCLDVEISKPTARGGQTLVRLKVRARRSRAVCERAVGAGLRGGSCGQRLGFLEASTLLEQQPGEVVERVAVLGREGERPAVGTLRFVAAAVAG